MDKNNTPSGDQPRVLPRLPRRLGLAVLLGLVLQLALWLSAEGSKADGLNLKLLETDQIRLVYADPMQSHLVPHVVRNAHNAMAFQQRVFAWTPSEKPTVLLVDLEDYGNAGAGVSPYNAVVFYVAPVSKTLETQPSSELVFTVMNHELVHVANMDVANSQDLRWRRLFGGKPIQTDEHPLSILYNYLTVPRRNVPRWYTEGAAVFMETWMAGGVGRAQGAFDEMVFRAMVRDRAHFYSNLGIVSEGVAVDFQTGANAYLYGGRFVSYLAEHYSPEHLIAWMRRDEGSQRYYSKQFQQVFGLPLEQAWQDWIAFEQDWQRQNLARIREQALTPLQPITNTTLGSISRSYVDPVSNSLVGGFRYPGVVAHVGALDIASGKLRRITDIKGPMKYRVTSTAWDPDSRTLFYAEDNIAFRDLRAVNIDTGKVQRLLEDARIGDLVVNPVDKALWGIRHQNGYVSLVRLQPPYRDWQLVHAWPYGQVAYELDISPDGQLLSLSLGKIDGSQELHLYPLAALQDKTSTDASVEPLRSFQFGTAVPEGFVFSPDGRYLYGSSFYTGVSNIFRWDVASGDMEAVSNAETGLFRPMPQVDGSMLAFEFTGTGFVPVHFDPLPLDDVSAIRFLGTEIANSHPEVRDWNLVPSLRQVDFAQIASSTRDYQPMRELQYDSGYPVLEGYRDSESIGWHWQFKDPAQLHALDITAGWSWDDDLDSDEQLHVNARYQLLNWRLNYRHNDANFYDLFGPTKRSRKGDAWIVGYERSLISDDPRTLELNASLAWYTGLDTLPQNQNVQVAAFDEIRSAEVELLYSNTRKSLGAVDHEQGWRWQLDLQLDNTDDDTVFRPRAGLDAGMALPWRHSSVWLYNAVGTATGQRSNPLGNNYFGSFGNNYVDDGEVKRYREMDSFPGYDIDELQGQAFAKTVAEWNLPPVRFRAAGTPALFLSHLRPALFAGALVTDPGSNRKRTRATVGAQVDLQFTLVHRLPMTLSLGWAAGLANGGNNSSEWLVSLKVL